MELTAIEDFEKLGEDNEFFKELAEICKKNNNVWCEEAEKFLLAKKSRGQLSCFLKTFKPSQIKTEAAALVLILLAKGTFCLPCTNGELYRYIKGVCP